jgi:HNH endonuclease
VSGDVEVDPVDALSPLHRDVQGAVALLEGVIAADQLGGLSDVGSYTLANLLSHAARLASSGVALLAPKVAKEGIFTRGGHATASDWLGAVNGSSLSAAKGQLAAAVRAAEIPEVAQALQEGQLSGQQLEIVTAAEAVAPGATGQLLALVAQGASNQKLCGEARLQRQAARSGEAEQQRRQRVQASRYFRVRQDPLGGMRGSFFCDEVAWAQVARGLEAHALGRFRAAGARGESLDAHRLDVALEVMGGGEAGAKTKATHRAIVVIDAESLRRGTTQGDEMCEIDGIGPVSVQAGTELLGEAAFEYVVKEGRDIRTVTSSTRTVPQPLRTALLVRDRTCAVVICGQDKGLEIDHCKVDFAQGGQTELSNLARLCHNCHELKTYGHYTLVGAPGTFALVAPKDPPTRGQMDRNRRVQVAKAAAIRRNKAKDRNHPMQT